MEASFQSGILFDIFPIFRKGSGTDDLHFSPRQGGLDDIGGIYGTLCRARADDGVDLVDKNDDIGILLNLCEDAFQPFLKFSAVFRARDHACEVQGDDGLVAQDLGNVSVGDPLCQALRHGGLSNPRLTDEAGVVFRSSRQDLNDALGLLIPPDDRVDPSAPCHFAEITSKASDGTFLSCAFTRYTVPLLFRVDSSHGTRFDIGFDVACQLPRRQPKAFQNSYGNAIPI